jgi:hypothetical protein
MWKRLSDAEIAQFDIEESQRRRRLRGPLLIASVMSLGMTALWMLGYRGGLLSGVVMVAPGRSLLAPRVSDVLVFLFIFGFMFRVAYRRQRAGGSFLSDPPSVICGRCQTLADAGASARCSCGDPWDTIDHWQWVDE